MQHLEKLIEHAFDNRAQGFANRDEIEAAVNEAVALLDSGKARVAERGESGWQVNQWLKKAVLLSFALAENKVVESGHSRFYDKVPMKGQSPIATGDGPVGAKSTSELIGLGAVGPNINAVTENPVVPADGLHRGTIAGVYGDTGIFYSTDPDAAIVMVDAKTGYIRAADYCLATLVADKNGQRMTAVVLGVPGNKLRFRECRRMLDWGFRTARQLASAASLE